jgi:single-stranded DNA-binding protein
VTEIIANDVQFLEPRGAGAAAPARSAGPHNDHPAPDDAPRDVDPDEIPF